MSDNAISSKESTGSFIFDKIISPEICETEKIISDQKQTEKVKMLMKFCFIFQINKSYNFLF